MTEGRKRKRKGEGKASKKDEEVSSHTAVARAAPRMPRPRPLTAPALFNGKRARHEEHTTHNKRVRQGTNNTQQVCDTRNKQHATSV